MKKRKIASVNTKECVACGVCQKVCPISAIYIDKGMYAKATDKCVGCGKCSVECPASVITMLERETLTI